ncbi:hypothetical protein BDV30DRAFT_250961 [Aspergillus minisclerotigenes]|uniref:Protein kinase domain-containing protein n=1 Tax=Aspergillus minisclerotigenes TaxID=656917 RepID=A0A5N6IVZ2_9EURO|nr:hypothetical protein BDV30DRAFT_250961 [Aspergillus minisclerotigenes]
MEDVLRKPTIPYTMGRRLRVQSHITPSPTPVTFGCGRNDPAGRKERSLLTPFDRCVQNAPLPGKLGTRIVDLRILAPIRVGDGHSAQVFLAETSENQSVHKGKKIVVAKVYDPLYFDDLKGSLNPFLCVDRHYTHEVHTYDLLAEFQGGLIPEFYGSFSLDLSGSGSKVRTVRLILIEQIPGPSMLQVKPEDFSQQCRQQIIKSAIDFESMAYHRHIALNHLSPRNIMLLDPSDYPQRKIVFLDFGGTIFGRRLGGSDDDLFPGQYISPLLRWNWDMAMQFSDWIDWEF